MKTLALEQAIIKRLLEQEQEAPVSIQPSSTIYVDMDGVVVDFHTPMIGEINSILDAGLPDFLQGSKTSRRALRKIKKQMGEEYRVTKKIDLHNPLIRDLTFSIIKRKPYDYFVNLGQMKDGVEMLWPYVTSLPYRIEMLTASVQGLDPDKKTAEDAKKDWVATHLEPQPASVNVVMGAARKIPYATSNGVPNVLIDDRSDTIAKWNEAGGIGILHTTGNSASTARRLKDVVAQAQEAAKRKPRKKDVILESVIKRLLSEQPYKTPGQEYIALFLDGRSRDKLTDILDDPPPGWTLYADHMTVKFGSEGVPERYLGPAQCKVVGVALNDRVMTARVETDVPTQNAIPHITIATAPGAKPRESNDFSLDDFDDVDPIILKGEIRPKFSDTLQKKMPKI